MRENGTERDTGGEAGFVLVSILGIVALFVAASAGFAVKAHLHLLQTARLADAARLEAFADGVTLFVADALRQTPPPNGEVAPVREALPTDGRTLACGLADGALQTPPGTVVEVRIADAGGLLDLNAAPPEMLAAFLAAAGLDSPAAAGLASRIAAVRLPPQDGEPERRGPFLDVGELRVIGSEATRRLEPLFTVDNPQPGLDLATMDVTARALLPRDAERLPDLRPWIAASRAQSFRIDVAIVGRDGWTRAGRRATVRFANGQAGGPLVRRWSRPPFAFFPRSTGRDQASRHAFCGILAAAFGVGEESTDTVRGLQSEPR